MGRPVDVCPVEGGEDVTFNFTTQFYFDDAITDAIFARESPYKDRPARMTRNNNDGIYNEPYYVETITDVAIGHPVWAGDSRGIVFTEVNEHWRSYRARYHRLGTPTSDVP